MDFVGRDYNVCKPIYDKHYPKLKPPDPLQVI